MMHTINRLFVSPIFKKRQAKKSTLPIAIYAAVVIFTLWRLGAISGPIQFYTFFFVVWVTTSVFVNNFLVPLAAIAVFLSQFNLGPSWHIALPTDVFVRGGIGFEAWIMVRHADIVLVALMVLRAITRGVPTKPDRVSLLLAALAAWSAVSAWFSAYPVAALAGTFAIARAMFWYESIRRLAKDKRMASSLLIGLCCVALFQGVWTLYQYRIGRPSGFFFDQSLLRNEGMGTYTNQVGGPVFRPSGTFDDPNGLSMYLLVALPVLVALSLRTDSPVLAGLAFFSVTASLVAVLLSLSRTAWILGTIGAFVFWITNRQLFFLSKIWRRFHFLPLFYKTVIAAVLALVLYNTMVPRISDVFVNNQVRNVISSRLLLAEESLNVFLKHPIVGTGLNNFVPQAVANSPNSIVRTYPAQTHNIYLLVATELGVPGLLLILAIVGVILLSIYNSHGRVFPWAIYLGCLIFFLFGLSVPASLEGQQFVLLSSLLGFGSALSEKQ